MRYVGGGILKYVDCEPSEYGVGTLQKTKCRIYRVRYVDSLTRFSILHEQ